MSASVIGIHTWSTTSDEDGNRDYKIVHKVRTTANEGPVQVRQASGLPRFGSSWSFEGDSDPYAWCRRNRSATPYQQKEGNKIQLWLVESTFSTRPSSSGSSQRCQDQSITNPLDEPDRISGSFLKYTEEAAYTIDEEILISSSFEPLTGPKVEVDRARPTVRIEQNVATLGLSEFCNKINKVNSSPMWGLDKRCVKLSNVTWERRMYGTCSFYYTRTFEFDIILDGFDPELVDTGTRCLRGKWVDGIWTTDGAADRNNPLDFQAYKDVNGEGGRVFLNGYGVPIQADAEPYTKVAKLYFETNFFSLGIPSSL